MFDIFDSKGIKRTLASVFAFAAMVAPTIPVIAPYAEALQLIAGWFGVAGVAHAAASKVLK